MMDSVVVRVLRCLVIAALFLGGAADGRAQGFSSTNGRNHPELDWQVAETAHFKLMYPKHLAGIEAEAAPIAEASYDALSANLGVTFNRKIRIYFSDEDEIANGFAVPLGEGFTNIWVRHNDWATTWTGREKWLRKVIAHELAHIFHYRAISTSSRLVNFTLGNPLPRFWTEGLAQYQTERWDAQRGDRWLRTAVLDDQLSYTDGRSIWNGRLLYAVGNAQVRYFAHHYGDSTLTKLLQHRQKTLFGLASVHNFYSAFKDVTGKSYRDFYDEWRRHVNVYYNTRAGQMELVDSLAVEALATPGQYLYDVQFSPDTTHLAVVSLSSLGRPVRRLYVVNRATRDVEIVAEGAINPPVAWSPDGTRLAFSRRARGRHGSLLNDLFVVDVDGKNLRQLTRSRRASSPVFAPGASGNRLAFVGSEGGTANLFMLDLETGRETPLTHFTGDVQIGGVRWHPAGDRLVFARTAADGRRTLELLDLTRPPTASRMEGEGTGAALVALTDGTHDDRQPVWSPDGAHVAYTSLRDEVPNVFVVDPATGTHRRVTHLATGAAIHDWLPPDSAHTAGTLVVVSNVTKRRDRAYRIDAARTVDAPPPVIAEPYAAWTRHRPPREVPSFVPPDSLLVTSRRPYNPWSNLTHAGSILFPYFNSEQDWGIFGGTVWVEPLAKHLFSVFGGFSVASPEGESFLLASYVNRQFYPTFQLNLYRFPGSARTYGDNVLVEDFIGGDILAFWPLDWSDHPYVGEGVGVRFRVADVEPLNPEDFEGIDVLPPPESGQETELRLSFTRRKLRPYRHNLFHTLDGQGFRLRVTGAARVFGADSEFLRADLRAYNVFRVPFANHRIYIYGRVQAQTGKPRAQDYIGFSRRDGLQFELPGFIPLAFSGADRVRGYRTFAIGDRVLFGVLEYRMPLVSDLQTRILGLVSFEGAALAVFADAGMVWSEGAYDQRVERLGVGVEVKNAVRLGGFLKFGHAFGLAQPADDLGTRDNYEFYYRIRGAVPF